MVAHYLRLKGGRSSSSLAIFRPVPSHVDALAPATTAAAYSASPAAVSAAPGEGPSDSELAAVKTSMERMKKVLGGKIAWGQKEGRKVAEAIENGCVRYSSTFVNLHL